MNVLKLLQDKRSAAKGGKKPRPLTVQERRALNLSLIHILAVLILSGSLVILGNLLSDILYCVADPRIKSMK